MVMPQTHPSAYQSVMTFGKYAGQSLGYIKDTNPNYLTWLITSDTIPAKIQEAAAAVLRGDDISQLSLSKAKTVLKANDDSISFSDKKPIIRFVGKGKSSVQFPYNKIVLGRFKSEIDSRVWNNEHKYWEVNIVQLGKVIKLFGGPQYVDIDEDSMKAYMKEVKRRESLDEIRDKIDSNLKIEGLKLDLYPYQKVAVDFIQKAGGRALVADSMGLGKTATAIGYAVHTKKKTLIICPASVKINWAREIEKFAGKKSCVWDGKTTEGHKNNQFHIINYDNVAKRVEELRAQNFECLVLDECTYVKNKTAERSKAIFGYGRAKKYGLRIKDCIMLSGTPILNRPTEAFVLLNYLSKERFPNFYGFVQRYGGWKGEQERNLDELHDRTKDLIIRRRQEEVQNEMPGKQINEVYIELDSGERKEYNQLLKEMFGTWKNATPNVTSIHKIQKFLIEKKMNRVHEMIDAFHEEGRSVLLFSVYKDALYATAKKYGKLAGVISGDESLPDRQKVIDGIADGSLKLACATIGAAKMGIDGLQKGCNVVIFLDYDWVPANHDQAEGRLDRKGQTEKVQVFYAIVADTIEETRKFIIESKREVVNKIVDGRHIAIHSEKSMFKEFVKMVQESSQNGKFFDA